MFTHSKVAQIAAWFASKAGGKINVLRLMKLMYLADRESMDRHGFPISFDRFVSMDHGPVLSRTLNLVNGDIEGPGGAQWQRWISDRDNYELASIREVSRADLDELSDADIAILDQIWQRFGEMNQWQLRDYTHADCPEWKDPNHSSVPIRDQDVLEALGRDEQTAREIAEEIEGERALDAMLADM